MEDAQKLAQANETLQAMRAAQASANGKPMIDANGVQRHGLRQAGGFLRIEERLARIDLHAAQEQQRAADAAAEAQRRQDAWEALPEAEKQRLREEREAEARERARKLDLIEKGQRIMRWKYVENHVGIRYANCTLDNYEATHEPQREILRALRDYAASISSKVADGVNIVFLGPPGTGKDHLMIAVLREAALRIGVQVKWANGVDMFGAVRDAFDQSIQEADLFSTYTTPAVLAISDPTPPCGSLTEWQRGVLFRIIDDRYRRKRPTYVTMNSADRKEAEEAIGPNIIDRLGEDALVLKCDWPSFRQRNQ